MAKKVLGIMGIPSDLNNYLQRVFYELGGYKSLVLTITEYNDKSKVNKNEIYQTLMKEYKEKNIEFNLIMNEIKEMFIEENKEFEQLSGLINLVVNFSKEEAEFFLEESDGGK